MKKNNKYNRFIKFIFIFVIVYFIYTFILQQKTLISYANDEKNYDGLIKEQEEYKQELLEIKQNMDSKEYIEQMAREKLDMYLPNERVYIDKEK